MRDNVTLSHTRPLRDRALSQVSAAHFGGVGGESGPHSRSNRLLGSKWLNPWDASTRDGTGHVTFCDTREAGSNFM